MRLRTRPPLLTYLLRMICLSNGHHISNSSNPWQQRTGFLRGFICVKNDAELRGSDSVMQAVMCSCELQIQLKCGTGVQAPTSVVATILHTTPRCCRLFFDSFFPKKLEPSRPAAMCCCELQIQWWGGTWDQAAVSVVATISRTTRRCCRLFFFLSCS